MSFVPPPTPVTTGNTSSRPDPVRGLGLVIGALLVTACGAAPEPLESALLVTLDTTRADAVAGFGGDPRLTPHLDAFGARALRFRRARTVAPVTLPAHASMLTGLTPPRHGLRDNGLAALAPEARTTAEVCRAAGLRTAAFVSASVLDPLFGLDQGFERYDAPPRAARAGSPIVDRTGAQTVERARAWLAALEDDERFFLWVHLYDPHLPYAPPAEFLERAEGRPYHGEVASMDAAVGELLGALDALGRGDRTLVLVVADHGEGLGDHGEPGHGALAYESTVRVPFLVRRPGGEVGASDVPASVVDVHPTVLGQLGLAAASATSIGSEAATLELDGVDLLDPRGVAARREGVYVEAMSGYLHYGWSPLAGWVRDEEKYLHSSRPELYVLATDPGERVDLAALDPARCERALTALRAHLSLPTLGPASFEHDAELLAALRKLGYAGNEVPHLPSPLDPTDLPSARDRSKELVPLLDGHRLLEARRFGESVAVLEGLVRENPAHRLGLELLAYGLLELGRFTEATERYEALLALDGAAEPRADVLLNLARAREALGELPRARELLERLLASEPGNEEARAALARIGSGA